MNLKTPHGYTHQSAHLLPIAIRSCKKCILVCVAYAELFLPDNGAALGYAQRITSETHLTMLSVTTVAALLHQ